MTRIKIKSICLFLIILYFFSCTNFPIPGFYKSDDSLREGGTLSEFSASQEEDRIAQDIDSEKADGIDEDAIGVIEDTEVVEENVIEESEKVVLEEIDTGDNILDSYIEYLRNNPDFEDYGLFPLETVDAEPEQPQIAQIPAPAPSPAPITPPVTPPAETQSETQPTLAETETEAEEEQYVPPRMPLPPVRETLPPPAPAGTIVVPQQRQSENPAWQPESASDVVYSRVVRATVGQIIEIPFRGSGWVYLGELAAKRGVAYDSRRNDPDGMSFIFKAEEAGTYALKFSRRDYVRDYILNDHVEVIIGEAPNARAGWVNPPSDRDRVIAQPRWPSVSEEAEILRGGSSAAARPGAQPRWPSVSEEAEILRGSAGTVSADTSSTTRSTSSQQVQPELSTSAGSEQFREFEGSLSPTAARDPSNISEVIRGTGTSSAEPSRAGPPNLPVYEPPAISGLPGAPSAAASSPNGQQSNGAAQTQGSQSQLSSQVALSGEEVIPVDQLIQRAKETFDAGNAAAAIALLDRYKENFPSGTDELYWLYGQFYEANTPSRDIKESLRYYRLITSDFPQSSRFNDARRRIAYLERFYINIQ